MTLHTLYAMVFQIYADADVVHNIQIHLQAILNLQ
jgi:hypothetical protein